MRAVVAALTVSREEIRAHVAPPLSPRTIGNRPLAAGFRPHVPLVRLQITARHRQARLLSCRERVDWRVEWHSFVLFMRVLSVCMRGMYAHVYGVDLESVIFRSAFSHET